MQLTKFIFLLLAQLILAIVVTLALNSSPAAQPTRISHTLSAGESIRDYAVSPDGRYAVYSVQNSEFIVTDIYSVRVSTNSAFQISGARTTGGKITGFQISPDGNYVVFRGDLRTGGVNELYSAPIGSGSRVVLHGIAGTNPRRFSISGDSAFVVYELDSTLANSVALYSVPIRGGFQAQLSKSHPGDIFDETFKISADSSRVIFWQRKNPLSQSSDVVLYSTAIIGGDPAELFNYFGWREGEPLPLRNIVITPDSKFVLYQEVVGGASADVLARVPIEGGDRFDLTNRISSFFMLSPDGRRIVYNTALSAAAPNVLVSSTMERLNEMTALFGALPGESKTLVVEITPDSAHVVFIGLRTDPNSSRLYSVPIDGGTVARLTSLDDPFIQRFQMSTDGKRVVFIENNSGAQAGEDTRILFSVPVEGGPGVKLAGEIAGTSSIDDYQIAPDSERVLFTGVFDGNPAPGVFSVPIAGGTRDALSNRLIKSGCGEQNCAIPTDGSRAFFVAEPTASRRELFRAPIGGKALTLDFDGDDRILANSDILMLLRRRLGASADAMIAGGRGVNARNFPASTIAERVDAVLNDQVGINRPLDIDLNGSVGTATDMVMILRYALGLRGSAITQGALGAPNTFPQRTDPAAIENHLRYLFTTYEVSGQG
jgi:Tol biopolymer transport system component